MPDLQGFFEVPFRTTAFCIHSSHTVRADFNGGGLSSDLGPVLLRGVDRQIGLAERLTAALTDRRHASDISHSYRTLLTQRIYQIACG
jgi:hypothetical protein